MRRILFVIIFFLSASAFAFAAEKAYDAHTEVRLVIDRSEIKSGESFKAGIVFRMDEHWHIYWKNPGDSGLPPSVKWILPDGMSAGKIKWPAPEKIDVPPLTSYGYSGEVLLAADFTAGDIAPEKPVVLKTQVEWLACEVECIPGKAELEISAPFQAQPGLFEAEEKNYPQQNPALETHAAKTADEIKLTFSGMTSQAYFFAENSELIAHAKTQVLKSTERGSELSLPLAVTHPKSLDRLRGVLASEGGHFELDIPFQAPVLSAEPQLGLITAIVFALIGGLILNLMPCVLPVLSLKILGFVNEAGKSRASVLKQGLIFAAGVLVSFWILAGVLILFKSAGQQIGWGFQLQSPWVVGVLAVIFFLLALNLFGFFEIGLGLTSAGQNIHVQGSAASFLSGVLTVVVAAPCTAPFMGTALGYALTQPAFTAWAVFTALGFGLALPYLILSANPSLLKWIPKPGPWMITLKKIFGMLLLLSSFWLIWILAVQTGMWAKVFQNEKVPHQLEWENYSETRLAELRAANRPVFVDFTAAWCLTCQVNERIALNRKETADFFREHNIAALKADWTNRDEAVTRALAAHGRSSIPFYLIYPAGGGSPRVFPEILTLSLVRETLEKALGLQNEKN